MKTKILNQELLMYLQLVKFFFFLIFIFFFLFFFLKGHKAVKGRAKPIDIENFKNDCSKTHNPFVLYGRSKALNSKFFFF
jgi:hypothetical protein